MATKKRDSNEGIKTSNPAKGLLFGGISSCIAEAITIPVDVVKTRMQIQGELGATRQYKK
ncbi:MAG TPA: MC/SLC25 family protein [Oculatellaceae cyanobacterium]